MAVDFFLTMVYNRCNRYSIVGGDSLECVCIRCGTKFNAKRKTAVCLNCHVGVCIICGTEFELKSPWTQKTCSSKCRGIYRKQSGISKLSHEKAAATMMERYGLSNPSRVSKPTEAKTCPICGESFIPDTFRQVYCKNTHYGPCPICGKPVAIKDIHAGPTTCSDECRRQLTAKTCLMKYGDTCVLNSEYGRSKRIETCMKKYKTDHYSKTAEFRTRFENTMMERFGVRTPLHSPDIYDKVRTTNEIRYGGVAPTCDPEVMRKVRNSTVVRHGGIGFGSPTISSKIRNTMIQKFGVDSPTKSNEIRDRISSTNILKYGFKYPMQNPDVRQRVRITMKRRYGVEYIWQDPLRYAAIREKAMKTMLTRYGVKNASQSESLLEKSSATFMRKYGVPWYVLTPDCSDKNIHTRVSKLNRSFSDCLESAGISHSLEFCVEHKFFDFATDVALIELNPTITHNSYISIFKNCSPVDSDYHLKKSKLANSHGYRCIHVFDWDSWDHIIQLVSPSVPIYARCCVVKPVDMETANQFTNENHIQGSCRGQVVNYGLYFDNSLVAIMTFGKPRYNHHYDFELLRLCTLRGFRVIGGASKLFTAFVTDHTDSSVISYCDLAKFSGDVYTKIGMMLYEITPPAKVWSKGSRHITDNLLRQRGFDQLFRTSYGKGTNNEELMLKHGWLPVYDCGQAVYVWNK